MFAIVLLLLVSTRVHGLTFTWDTNVEYHWACPEYWAPMFAPFVLLVGSHHDWGACVETVKNTGTTCNIYIKNGPTDTVAVNGADGTVTVSLPSGASAVYDTLMWTTCDDAMLVNEAFIGDYERRWTGDRSKGWCLSLDASDAERFRPPSHHIRTTDWKSQHVVEGLMGCWRMLNFQGQLSSFFNPTVTGSWLFEENYDGRRKLEGMPTLDEVKACEADAGRPQEECTALADQILAYQMIHPEGFEVIEEVAHEEAAYSETSADAEAREAYIHFLETEAKAVLSHQQGAEETHADSQSSTRRNLQGSADDQQPTPQNVGVTGRLFKRA